LQKFVVRIKIMSRTNPLFVEFSQKVTLRFEEKNPWRRLSSWDSFVHVFPFRLAGSHNENLHRILWNTFKDLVMENKFEKGMDKFLTKVSWDHSLNSFSGEKVTKLKTNLTLLSGS